jgi:hypothetical protein
MLVMLMGTLNTSVAVAKSGAYGPLLPQRAWAQAERMPVEEALLNFKIEAPVDGMVPKGCGAHLKPERDRRLLDPQLPTTNKQNNLDPSNSMRCTEIESVLPMNQ